MTITKCIIENILAHKCAPQKIKSTYHLAQNKTPFATVAYMDALKMVIAQRP